MAGVGRSLGAPVALVLAVLLSLALAAPPAVAGPPSAGPLVLAGSDAVDTAIAFSQIAFPDGATEALLGRSDTFPDSLASGVLQSGRPLLLTPSDRLGAAVVAELTRLGARSVTLLGGTAALGPAVADALTASGYAVRRLAGADRIETAIAVARAVPGASTALLARSAGDVDPTAGFADALGAGALAAQRGWPILLTATGGLSPATREYLRSSVITTVVVVGGPAAVSDAVVDELRALGLAVRRAAGTDRSATAVAVAAERGFGRVGDTGGAILLDGHRGDAFAPGFAAAAYAAARSAVIVLASGASLPAATAAYLSDGAAPLVCAPLVDAAACAAAAELTGHSPSAVVTVTGVGTNSFTAEGERYRYDSDDRFRYASGGVSTGLSRQEFAAYLSPADRVEVTGDRDGRTSFRLLRDVPAAPGGVSAVRADTDADGAADDIRVSWTRPTNPDVAGYRVERAPVNGQGGAGTFAVLGTVRDAGTLTYADPNPATGRYTYRVVAANANGDLSPASAQVQADAAGPGGGTGPVAAGSTFARAGGVSGNNILDRDDVISVTFRNSVTVAAGATVVLRDTDGTQARVVRDRNARFTIRDTRVLDITMTGPPELLATDGGNGSIETNTLVAFESATGITDATGGWNLPASGRTDDNPRTRVFAGANTGLPAALPTDRILTDPASSTITLRPGAANIATGDPVTASDARGQTLASGIYDATLGTTLTASTGFAAGALLQVVYTDLSGNRLPSRTATVSAASGPPTAVAVTGADAQLTVTWSRPVTTVGAASGYEVFNSANATRVTQATAATASGSSTRLTLAAGLTSGTAYTLRIAAGRVRDAAGGTNAAQALAFTAAGGAPTLAVSSGPANGATVTVAQPTFGGSASDDRQVVAVQRRIDSDNEADWTTTGVVTSPSLPRRSVTWSFTTPVLNDGPHTVEFRAVDDGGQRSPVVTRAITVSAATPTMSDAVVASGTAAVVVTSSEPVTCPSAGAAAWSLDDASPADSDRAAAASTNTTGLAANQCRVLFSGPAFTDETFGTLTYTRPSATGQRVTDAQGVALGNGAVGVRDATAPTFAAVSAAAGSSDVVLTFSERIRCDTLDGADLEVLVDGAPRAVASVNCPAGTAVAAPTVRVAAPALTAGQTVSVTVLAGADIRDQSGNVVARPQTRTTTA